MLINEQVTLCPARQVYAKELSTTYGSLAFNQFFINDFEGAIESSDKGLEQIGKFTENDWLYTNLALGYLLTGKYKTAEPIYREYKDKMYTDKRNSFKRGFLEDFRDLEDAGVFKNLSETILNDIAKIKVMLNEPSNKIPSTR
ncbi:MAG: tetratricopeptide repeat protein [Ferruginibacter sp.]|nr:tetratricopeptide repeat protein [Ferruginibacter sp.]